MSEAPDIPTAWQWLLERRPGTRGYYDTASLLPIAEAAHAEPRLRALYPFPTHGTLHFLRSAPPWDPSGRDDLPFILAGAPPYRVYASGYAELLGEGATPEAAAALAVANLPQE